MKLSEFVATAEDAPQALLKPFRFVDANGAKWAGASDGKTLFFVKAKVKLPELKDGRADRIAAWAAAEVASPQKTTVSSLSVWTGPADGVERKGVLLGVQIDLSRLAKLLSAFSEDLEIWDASDVVGIPCLGLVAKKGVVKAFLAGYNDVEDDVPTFEVALTGSELFDLAMDL